jgi:hypothetical protein
MSGDLEQKILDGNTSFREALALSNQTFGRHVVEQKKNFHGLKKNIQQLNLTMANHSYNISEELKNVTAEMNNKLVGKPFETTSKYPFPTMTPRVNSGFLYFH